VDSSLVFTADGLLVAFNSLLPFFSCYNQPDMRLALFGSPSFAIPTLHALREKHEVILVVTQPDKPAGRGNKLTSPPLAEEAKKLGLRLEQPDKLKNNEDFHNLVRELNLEVAITAAYGKILPQRLLDIPKHGFLNVHGSLLPKYRGAAPIQWALINSESETGISIMQTEAGLDTGPVRLVKKLKIEDSDNALTLFEKLSKLGAEAMTEALELLSRGELPSIPQDDSLATHAAQLEKEDGRIRWQESATQIFNRFRGVIAYPGSWTMFKGDVLKVHDLQVLPPLPRGVGGMNTRTTNKEAGSILEISKEGVMVGTGDSAVLLETVQPASKPKMPAHDWANGYRVKVEDRLE
jgi:methionyl-tRNA formyltransferase